MTRHFKLPELVDPYFLANHTEYEVWALLDPLALQAIDELRDRFGPILINGRGYTESGLRRSDTATGAKYSQHKSGAAFDLKFLSEGVTPRKVFEWIVSNPVEAYGMGIRRVEDIAYTARETPPYFGWLHIDSKDTGANNINKIVIVRP
jgi:Peptidase M15